MRRTFKVFVVLTLAMVLITSTTIAGALENIKVVSKLEEVTYTVKDNIITVSWGEKPTGGYSIKITDLKLDKDNNLLVYYKTESPKDGDAVTLAITYPRDSQAIPRGLRNYREVKLIGENIIQTDGVAYAIKDNVITVSWGEKPTGGYSIKITDLKLDKDNNLLVYYKTESPKDGDFVTQVITYPTDSKTIPKDLSGYRGVMLIEYKNAQLDEVTYTIKDNVITLNWGEKPTGGYTIKVTDLKLDLNSNLLVYYKTESPKSGDIVTQVITYPRDTKEIPRELRDHKGIILIEDKDAKLDQITYKIVNNIVTISWGEKPTGGYSIKITDLALDKNNNLIVYYKTTSPKKGDLVTEAITYPSDSQVIPVDLRNYYDVKFVLDTDNNAVDNKDQEKKNPGKGPNFDRIIQNRIEKAMKKVDKINGRIDKNEKQLEKFQEQILKTINKTNQSVDHFLDKLDFFADRYSQAQLVNIKDNINRRLIELEKMSKLSLQEKEVLKNRPLEERLYIRGEKLTYDVPPVIINGRTLVPARIISEHLGATVKWNDSLQKVTIVKNNTTIELFINNKVAIVNGRQVELDVPAYILNGRTMVPIRFICDTLGESLDYIIETGDIDIGNGSLDAILLITN